MNQLLTSNTTSFELHIFKDLKAMTRAECRSNIFFLKYLLSKETNTLIQDKYRNYIQKLTNRFLELNDSR